MMNKMAADIQRKYLLADSEVHGLICSDLMLPHEAEAFLEVIEDRKSEYKALAQDPERWLGDCPICQALFPDRNTACRRCPLDPCSPLEVEGRRENLQACIPEGLTKVEYQEEVEQRVADAEQHIQWLDNRVAAYQEWHEMTISQMAGRQI
jgi:hypothetical protein